MPAGTLALLESPADEPLEDYSSGGFSTLDVRGTQTYLDDATIQHGRAAATIEATMEEIHIDGSTVDVETVDSVEHTWTEWIADVTDAGFVVAERTGGDDPPFPFDMLRARTGQRVEPAHIDVGGFIARQRDADRDYDVWFTGRREETEEDRPNNVSMQYGMEALKKDAINAEVGVGFKTPWHGTVVKGIIYQSGYLSVYSPSSWGAMQFGRFVREEILPVAWVPEDDGEEQTELGDAGEGAEADD